MRDWPDQMKSSIEAGIKRIRRSNEPHKIKKIQAKNKKKKELGLNRCEMNVKKALEVPKSTRDKIAPKLAIKKEKMPYSSTPNPLAINRPVINESIALIKLVLVAKRYLSIKDRSIFSSLLAQ